MTPQMTPGMTPVTTLSAIEVFRLAGCEAAVWRDAVPWQGGRAAAVGQVRCADGAGGAALLRAIADAVPGWLLAPLDGDTWHSYRLATGGDGRPPFALEPPADPVLQAALASAGFVPVLHYASAALALEGARVRRLGTATLRLRPYDPSRAEAELRLMHRLALAGFARAPLFTPILFEPFAALYRPYLPRLVRDLVLFAEEPDGTPAGFVFGLPDVAEGAAPSTAILKTYAALRPGVGAVLAGAFHDAARWLGFRVVIHALMHEDNASLRHSRLLGGEVFRRYALFGRPPA